MNIHQFKQEFEILIDKFEKENQAKIVDITIFTKTVEMPVSKKTIETRRTITISIQ